MLFIEAVTSVVTSFILPKNKVLSFCSIVLAIIVLPPKNSILVGSIGVLSKFESITTEVSVSPSFTSSTINACGVEFKDVLITEYTLAYSKFLEVL